MNIKLQQLGNKGAYINTEQSCIIQNDFFCLATAQVLQYIIIP